MPIVVEGGIDIGPGITIGAGTPTPSPTLLLELDATDYSGSGSTWTAAVGSNATLNMAPAYTASSPTYFNFYPLDLQYATTPDVGNLSTWTIESWFRVTGTLSSQITTVAGAEYYSGYINYSLAINPISEGTGVLKAAYYNNVSGGWQLTSGFIPTINTWYYVVGTYDGTTLKQYQNGTLQSSNATAVPSLGAGGEFRIAGRWDSLASTIDYFPGDIAIVKVYSGARDATAVTATWNADKARFGY